MNIAVFCGSSVPKNGAYMAAASELGAAIAQRGHTLVYGGSNLGLMGAVSGAAMQAGGRVVAIIPTLFAEGVITSQPVSELVRVADMAERKKIIMQRSDVFVALPGGIGTIDEVSEVMVANQLNQMHKPMVLLNIGGFYDLFLHQLDAMRAEGFLRSVAGVQVVGSVAELWDIC